MRFSRPRLSAVAEEFGRKSGPCFDIKVDAKYDARTEKGRDLIRAELEREDPDLISLTPVAVRPKTGYSNSLGLKRMTGSESEQGR